MWRKDDRIVIIDLDMDHWEQAHEDALRTQLVGKAGVIVDVFRSTVYVVLDEDHPEMARWDYSENGYFVAHHDVRHEQVTIIEEPAVVDILHG